MDAKTVVDNLALSIIAGAYVLLFAIQLVLWNRLEKIIGIVTEVDSDVKGRFEVIDRVASTITDEEFNSKAVASGQQKPPSTYKIRRLLNQE